MKPAPPCPECDSDQLYETTEDLVSGGGLGPALLPRLGGMFSFGKLSVVVCADCGLMRLFASRGACAFLGRSPSWNRVVVKPRSSSPPPP